MYVPHDKDNVEFPRLHVCQHALLLLSHLVDGPSLRIIISVFV